MGVDLVVVVKGPLLRFTREVLKFYTSRGLHTVYSGRRDGCLSPSDLAFIDALDTANHSIFAHVLSEQPPRDGYAYRNSQREAAHAGIALAVQRWAARLVLVHRSDAAFQGETAARAFSALYDAQAKLLALVRPAGAWGPLGLSPFQTQFTDYFGRYHLCDHVLLGEAGELLRFFSTHNPYYYSNRSASTTFDDGVPHNQKCPVPGPESENGMLWMQWEAAVRGTQMPRGVLDLLREGRVFFLNPHAPVFDYVSSYSHAIQGSLPLKGSSILAQHRFKVPGTHLLKKEPFGAMSLCTPKDLTYECSHLFGDHASTGIVRARFKGLDWPCPLPARDRELSETVRKSGDWMEVRRPGDTSGHCNVVHGGGRAER
jgi:hypothetical protein